MPVTAYDDRGDFLRSFLTRITTMTMAMNTLSVESIAITMVPPVDNPVKKA